VPVQSHGGGGFEQLPVQRAEDTDVIVGARGGAHDAVVGVHHLQELADDQGHGLDALDLLLGVQHLPLQVQLLLLNVLLLDIQKLQLALQGLEAGVQVLLRLRVHLCGVVRARGVCEGVRTRTCKLKNVLISLHLTHSSTICIHLRTCMSDRSMSIWALPGCRTAAVAMLCAFP